MQAWTSSSTYYLRLGENLGPQFLFPVFSFLFLSARAFACLASQLRFVENCRTAMLRSVVGYGMTLIVLLLGATPCSALFVAPLHGGLLRVKVSSVVVWLYHPFLFNVVYAPICPHCSNNAPSCNWAKGGGLPYAANHCE